MKDKIYSNEFFLNHPRKIRQRNLKLVFLEVENLHQEHNSSNLPKRIEKFKSQTFQKTFLTTDLLCLTCGYSIKIYYNLTSNSFKYFIDVGVVQAKSSRTLSYYLEWYSVFMCWMVCLSAAQLHLEKVLMFQLRRASAEFRSSARILKKFMHDLRGRISIICDISIFCNSLSYTKDRIQVISSKTIPINKKSSREQQRN